MTTRTKPPFTSLWVTSARDVSGDGRRDPWQWHHKSRSEARASVRRWNAKDSWLRLAGYRAYIVGKFVLRGAR